MRKIYITLATLGSLGIVSQSALAEINPEMIFKKKCKMCHSIDKKKVGPAFKDMNKDPAVLKTTITHGRKMMPKFSKKLSEEEINAMVDFIQSKQPATRNPCDAKKPCDK